MKKFLFLLCFSVCISWLHVNAQSVISVEYNGTSSFYNNIEEAIDSAQAGSIIYLPGGSFGNDTLKINKTLHLIGVGHYPDSTTATGTTVLGCHVNIQTGADNGSLEGMFITGDVLVVDETLSNYSIKRCNFNALNFSNSTIGNLFVAENVIRWNVSGSINIIYALFEKNIFNYPVGNFFSGSNFNNNIFLFTNWYCLRTNSSVIFSNNIILDVWPLGSNYHAENCVFYNNIFVWNISFPYYSNYGYNNIVNQPASSIFINLTSSGFSYDDDYHLQPTCPGVGAGTDGTNIGIYGTGQPYKEGAVPSNPHIQSQSISVHNNQIQLDIKVSAQDN